MIRKVLTLTIQFYQRFISPLLGSRCRYYPTCSQYALESLNKHGLLKGCGLAVKRISRCVPWKPGGIDPVP